MRLERLSVPGCDVIVDVSTGAPTLLHWGAPLGDAALDTVAAALRRPVPGGSLDQPPSLSIVPEHGSGHVGRPGLVGHRRRGTAWAPRFMPHSVATGSNQITVVAVDPLAELELTTELSLDDVLLVSCTLAQPLCRSIPAAVARVTLPVPRHASELLTLHGRWTREFHVERRPFSTGTWLSENRSGRTSHEHPPLVFVGESGFGEWSGEVWGAHLAWSGNHVVAAEQLPTVVDACSWASCCTPASWRWNPASRTARRRWWVRTPSAA